jgi:hypothetical protein
VSHFIVTVRLPGSVEADEVESAIEKILAPYHEFECTGVVDEFVKSVDCTADVRAELANREDKTESVAEWIEDNHGWKFVAEGEQPDLEGRHKYGWFRVDSAGELVEAFDRTNPDKKWDWWVIGGRWSGYFPSRTVQAVESTVDAELRVAEEAFEERRKNRTGAQGEHEELLLLRRRVDALSKLAFAGRRRQPGVRLGRAGTFNNVPELGHSDYVRKRELDLDAVATKTRERIETFFAEYQRLIAGEKFSAFEGPRSLALDIGLVEVRQGPLLPGETGLPWRGQVPEDDRRADWHDMYKTVTLEQLFAEYADAFNPIAGYAFLDENGWHEPGEMGWWGCSSDTPETLLASKKQFTTWLKETPDDAWLVAVDCHI